MHGGGYRKGGQSALKQVREQIEMNHRRTAEAAGNSLGFVAENNILVWHDQLTGKRHKTVKMSASVDATGPSLAANRLHWWLLHALVSS
jgi:hypothetical protein